jgi:hypothetical protein
LTGWRWKLCFGLVITAVAAPHVRAQPLDVATCDAVKIERDALGASVVTALLQRGPEWAKVNASKSDLVRVARWIELEEQLTFQCGRGKVTDGAKRAAAMAEQLEAPPPAPPDAEKPAASPRVVVQGNGVAPVPPPVKPKAKASPQPKVEP